MFKRKALMESISSNLYNFLKIIGNNLSLPDKKFLRDSTIGLIRCGQPIVCQMARRLPNQQTKFVSRLDRLDRHLLKNSDFDNNIKEALPRVWLLHFRDDTPMMLLMNLPVENLKDAKRVFRFYIRRWECEEAIRFLKSQANLEKIRTFRWSAICRLVLLAVLVMIYLGWIVEEHPNICDGLVCLSQTLPDKPDFLSYCLLGDLTEAINTCFWLHKDLLRRGL